MISILIPLYRSARWLPVIERNVEEALSIGAEVVISDRHGFDDTVERLRKRFRSHPQVRCLARYDGADFVDNINSLLREAHRDYVRIVPHDDDASGAGAMRLLDALRADPHAVLAYGGIECIDPQGRRLPRSDTLHEHEPETPSDWNLSHVLPIFWTDRFNGAFKAVIRKNVITGRNLYIRKTPQVWYSERAWLFGLGLTGRFCRARGTTLRKRLYPESTHRQWRRTPEVNLGAAGTLATYANDLIQNRSVRDYILKDIYWNAARWARHPAPRCVDPGYNPYPEKGAESLRRVSLLPAARTSLLRLR